MLCNYNVDAHIMAYFLLLFRLNNPLLSHESRLQPKVNPSSVSGNDLMPHTADVKIIIVVIIQLLVKRKVKVQCLLWG